MMTDMNEMMDKKLNTRHVTNKVFILWRLSTIEASDSANHTGSIKI